MSGTQERNSAGAVGGGGPGAQGSAGEAEMIFADAEYDGPPQKFPKLSYMICGARRTGTTYLGKILWETGVLGKPFEYQLPECRQKIVERMGKGISYWDFLRTRRSTPNRVFGFKEVAPAGYRGRNLVADKIVYMSRRDEIAQAVSLVVAQQTGAFFSFQEGVKDKDKPEPEYNYDAIMGALIHICETRRMWEEILAEEGLPVLRLYYEDLGPDCVDRIAGFLGVSLEGASPVPAPEMRKQEKPRSKEWAARFKTEMEAAGCSIAMPGPGQDLAGIPAAAAAPAPDAERAPKKEKRRRAP